MRGIPTEWKWAGWGLVVVAAVSVVQVGLQILALTYLGREYDMEIPSWGSAESGGGWVWGRRGSGERGAGGGDRGASAEWAGKLEEGAVGQEGCRPLQRVPCSRLPSPL
jgi:hypothetical protein